MVVEKIITRAKNAVAVKDAPAADVHARREVGRLIKDKEVVKELFSDIAGKVASRPGGYTRIVKLGQRQGDGAEMAVIELVDFNTGQDVKEKATPDSKAKAKATKPKQPRKSKKASGKGKTEGAPEDKPEGAAGSQAEESR